MSLHRGFAEKLQKRQGALQVAPAGHPAVFEDRELPCVLVVDDEPEVTRSVAKMLDQESRVLTANSAEKGLELLSGNEVAVILTDQRMPGTTGVELLAKSLNVAPETTRILFTGYSDITAVIDAVNEGQVYRYITKPWNPKELKSIVSQGIERYRLIEENRRLLAELTTSNAELEKRVAERTRQLQKRNEALREARVRNELLLRTDDLTELTNRRWLDEVLRVEVNRARREHSPFSVVMADLDHFKDINDSFGHSAGDQVLKAAAKALRNAARITDVVGRYGGEEFLVLMPNTALQEAQLHAEAMRVGIRALPVTFRPQPLTASFGVAQMTSEDNAASLVDRADEALYRAKRTGRDQVVVQHDN